MWGLLWHSPWPGQGRGGKTTHGVWGKGDAAIGSSNNHRVVPGYLGRVQAGQRCSGWKEGAALAVDDRDSLLGRETGSVCAWS